MIFTHQCARHGEYTSENEKFMYWKDCPICVADSEEIKRKDQEKFKEERKIATIQARTKKSGIPDRFLTKRIRDYVAETKGQKSALAFAEKYATEFEAVSHTGRSAIFCGQPGTGKTHLATSIGHHVIEFHGTVLFSTVQRLVRAVKESWRKDSEKTESEIMDLVGGVDLLIIDEVGVQFGSEFEKNLMFDILNDRYEQKNPTILISNLSPSEVKAFLGERVFDRLREDGGVCVPFDWASHRGKA